MFKKYSTERVSLSSLFMSTSHLIEEKYFPSEFKVIGQLSKNKLGGLQFVGNYCKYSRLSMLINNSFVEYYRSCLLHFGERVNDYELLRQEMFAMEAYNCYYNVNDFLLKVPGVD